MYYYIVVEIVFGFGKVEQVFGFAWDCVSPVPNVDVNEDPGKWIHARLMLP
jgi:hypothetical protein